MSRSTMRDVAGRAGALGTSLGPRLPAATLRRVILGLALGADIVTALTA